MNEVKLSSNDLLPCPFCGETPELYKHFREDMWQLIHRCKGVGPIHIDWRPDIASITDKWNVRQGNEIEQECDL